MLLSDSWTWEWSTYLSTYNIVIQSRYSMLLICCGVIKGVDSVMLTASTTTSLVLDQSELVCNIFTAQTNKQTGPRPPPQTCSCFVPHHSAIVALRPAQINPNQEETNLRYESHRCRNALLKINKKCSTLSSYYSYVISPGYALFVSCTCKLTTLLRGVVNWEGLTPTSLPLQQH